MKFGKRLAAEAARCWTAHYLDYKAVKKAIKEDIRLQGKIHHYVNSSACWCVPPQEHAT